MRGIRATCHASAVSDLRYLLMLEIERPGTEKDPRAWMPATIDGERIVSRETAEMAARQASEGIACFLMVAGDTTGELTEAGRAWGDPSDLPRANMPLAMLPGENIWTYGEPTGSDLVSLLGDVTRTHGLDSMPSPDPDAFPVPAAEAIELARERFGDANGDVIDAAFVRLLAEIGGRKYIEETQPHVDDGLPATTLTVYLIPIRVLFGS